MPKTITLLVCAAQFLDNREVVGGLVDRLNKHFASPEEEVLQQATDLVKQLHDNPSVQQALESEGLKIDLEALPKKKSGLDIPNMFARHTLGVTQLAASNHLREQFAALAHSISVNTPTGPNQTLAIRHLEDALMRVNKALSEGQ